MTNNYKTLLWLGAGTAQRPSNLIENAKTVILIDAREEAVQHLNKFFAEDKAVSVEQKLVVGKDVPVEFKEYNFSACSAINSAEAISKIYPSLILGAKKNYSGTPVSSLVKGLKLSPSESNILVIDIADLAFELLKSLQLSGLLVNFETIVVATSDMRLYKDAATKSELTSWFNKYGFELKVVDDEDPDLLFVTFQLSPWWLENKQKSEVLNIRVPEVDMKEYLSALADSESLVEECFSFAEPADRLERINYYLNKLKDKHLAYFLLSSCLAHRFYKEKDNLMTNHFIAVAREQAAIAGDASYYKFDDLALLALKSGQLLSGLDLLVEAKIALANLEQVERKRFSAGYMSLRADKLKQQQHGHDLLIDYISGIESERLQDKVMVEVGTTRENVPGQGSTLLLAKLCHTHQLKFLTIDMDPNNAIAAKILFERLGVDAQAITMKGEDFLADYCGQLDYVFLDAYDFDHGKHSALRQSRYVKYLGAAIDEEQCHKMHLDCAKSIADKLADDGVVCVDDTWLDEEERWTAKGTLAVPYLINNGFEVIEARNRAVLMKRKNL